ncbi:hypothetical protein pb186bvf_010751 [Paramecium bursaria]
MENNYIKYRSHSGYSLPLNKYVQRMQSKNIGNSISQEIDLKSSYSILQIQFDQHGKVSIHTNRKAIRPYSSQKPERQDKPEFLNSAQYFHYSPSKVPSPLHQITLTKPKKNIIVKMPENRNPIKQFSTSELINQKLKMATRKQQPQVKSKPILHLEPKLSYSKLFSQINSDPVKYQHQAQKLSILFNKKLLEQIKTLNNQKLYVDETQ